MPQAGTGLRIVSVAEQIALAFACHFRPLPLKGPLADDQDAWPGRIDSRWATIALRSPGHVQTRPLTSVATHPGRATAGTRAGPQRELSPMGTSSPPSRVTNLVIDSGHRTGHFDPDSGRPGGGPEAVHQKVEQATGPGFMLVPGGHGEDADEGRGDVFGGDVGAEVARRATGVENRGDGRQ